MAYDDVMTRNENGELSVRTVSATEQATVVNPNDVYTRDTDGNLAIRTVGSGGSGDSHNKGYFATPEELRTAYPTAEAGDFAVVGSTDTIWVWDTEGSDWLDTDRKGEVTPDMIIVKSATMPSASTTPAGAVYQFTGTTNLTYTHGYIYENVKTTSYTGTVTFDPATISGTVVACDGDDFAGFIAEYIENSETITSGTMTYIAEGGLWAFVGKNADDETVGTFQVYQVDYENAGFTFTGTPEDNDVVALVCTIESTDSYAWVRLDVQPNDKNYENLSNKPKINGVELSGDKSTSDLGINSTVQVEVSGTSTVEGYTVPNPTAEEMTAIYNSVVAGNNVQIVDSNDVYYQVLQADSVDDAINIEALYFGELALLYTLENNTVTITGKKLGGGGLPDPTGHAGEFLKTDGTDASWGKALENKSTASHSLVIGDDAVVNAGTDNVAIGYHVTSASNSSNVAIGAYSLAMNLSTAVGYDSQASGQKSTAIGKGTRASASGSIAIGDSASAQTSATGIGLGSDARNYCVCVGEYTYAIYDSLAIGVGYANVKTRAAYYSIAIGNCAKAEDHGIAIGKGTTAGNGGVIIAAGGGSYKTGTSAILISAGANSSNPTDTTPARSIIIDASNNRNTTTPYNGTVSDHFYLCFGTSASDRKIFSMLDGITGLIPAERLGTGYDATKTQVLKNIQGVLTWVDEE